MSGVRVSCIRKRFILSILLGSASTAFGSRFARDVQRDAFSWVAAGVLGVHVSCIGNPFGLCFIFVVSVNCFKSRSLRNVHRDTFLGCVFLFLNSKTPKP